MLQEQTGNITIPSENEINISGDAGFGIKSFDLLNDSNNKCAVYSIELLIDSSSVFKYVMDAFSFNESRYINSHIDYEIYRRKRYILKELFLPNDKLSVYKNLVNRGIFNFNDNKIHHAEIIVTDMNDNKSTLSFKIKSATMNPEDVADKPEGKLMPYQQEQ